MVRILVRRLEPSPEAVECVRGAPRQAAGNSRSMREIAEEYNDMVIHPDKVRLNCVDSLHPAFESKCGAEQGSLRRGWTLLREFSVLIDTNR